MEKYKINLYNNLFSKETEYLNIGVQIYETKKIIYIPYYSLQRKDIYIWIFFYTWNRKKLLFKIYKINYISASVEINYIFDEIFIIMDEIYDCIQLIKVKFLEFNFLFWNYIIYNIKEYEIHYHILIHKIILQSCTMKTYSWYKYNCTKLFI